MDLFFVSAAPTEELALTGPSERLDSPTLPVRGDLAHIRLAGRVFVPHYAAPMPHSLTQSAELLTSPRSDGVIRETLPPGTPFNVLDIAGDWAWGQVGEDGYVGYLPLASLRRE